VRADEALTQELRQAVPGKVFLAAIYAWLGRMTEARATIAAFLKEDPSWAIAKEAVFPTNTCRN